VTLTNSTISGNSAGKGGGLYTQGGPTHPGGDPSYTAASMTVTNCTIACNSAVGAAGGIWDLAGYGDPRGSYLAVYNSTIAYNSVDSVHGAGLYIQDVTAYLYNTIVSDNYDDWLVYRRWGVEDDIAVDSDPRYGQGAVSGAYNLIGVAPVGLGVLKYNGGPTKTMAITLDSPAFNAGSNSLVPVAVTTDQRGAARIAGGRVDIGAFEAIGPSHANALPTTETSLSFPVSVTGYQPTATPSGITALDITTFDIYSSTNGGPWKLWTTVPASNPMAIFTGESNTIYAFYSLQVDQNGFTEVKAPGIEVSTYVPDLTPPVTSINGLTGIRPTKVDPATGTF
jgi:hypothetical protein